MPVAGCNAVAGQGLSYLNLDQTSAHHLVLPPTRHRPK